MFLFKTSGSTFDNVIINQKHAFAAEPQNWQPGELILISKNKTDCNKGEKQISYTMKLEEIRPLEPGEANKYWPGTEGRWKYLAICSNISAIPNPFNLEDVLQQGSQEYRPVVTFKKLAIEHEQKVLQHINSR